MKNAALQNAARIARKFAAYTRACTPKLSVRFRMSWVILRVSLRTVKRPETGCGYSRGNSRKLIVLKTTPGVFIRTS